MNQIEQKIRTVFEKSIPDVLDQIKKATVEKADQNDEIFLDTRKKPYLHFSLCAAILVCVLLSGTLISFFNNPKPEIVISIDVNPSFELAIDENEKIIKAVGLNDDAKKIFKTVHLENTNLNTALPVLMDSLFQNGYFKTEQNNVVLVSVMDKGKKIDSAIQENITNELGQILAQNKIGAVVLNQSVEIENQKNNKITIEDRQVSFGKMALLLKLTKVDPTLSIKELENDSLEKIIQLVEEKNIDITTIVGCHKNESCHESPGIILENTKDTCDKSGHGYNRNHVWEDEYESKQEVESNEKNKENKVDQTENHQQNCKNHQNHS